MVWSRVSLLVDQGTPNAESILLTGAPGGAVTGCIRGAGGTIPQSHAAGALASLTIKVQAHATQGLGTGSDGCIGDAAAKNAMYMDYFSVNGNYYGTAASAGPNYKMLMEPSCRRPASPCSTRGERKPWALKRSPRFARGFTAETETTSSTIRNSPTRSRGTGERCQGRYFRHARQRHRIVGNHRQPFAGDVRTSAVRGQCSSSTSSAAYEGAQPILVTMQPMAHPLRRVSREALSPAPTFARRPLANALRI